MQKEVDAYTEEKLKKALVFDPKDVASQSKDDKGSLR